MSKRGFWPVASHLVPMDLSILRMAFAAILAQLVVFNVRSLRLQLAMVSDNERYVGPRGGTWNHVISWWPKDGQGTESWQATNRVANEEVMKRFKKLQDRNKAKKEATTNKPARKSCLKKAANEVKTKERVTFKSHVYKAMKKDMHKPSKRKPSKKKAMKKAMHKPSKRKPSNKKAMHKAMKADRKAKKA